MRLPSEEVVGFVLMPVTLILFYVFALYGCSSDTQSAAPASTFIYTAAPLASCAPVPCAPVPCSVWAASRPRAEGPPPFTSGLATVRFGVMYSKAEAERKLHDLEELIAGVGWSIQVWKTASGKDAKVTHRLQASKVDPAAATAMCEWLATKGWKPGAVPCELREGIAPR